MWDWGIITGQGNQPGRQDSPSGTGLPCRPPLVWVGFVLWVVFFSWSESLNTLSGFVALQAPSEADWQAGDKGESLNCKIRSCIQLVAVYFWSRIHAHPHPSALPTSQWASAYRTSYWRFYWIMCILLPTLFQAVSVPAPRLFAGIVKKQGRAPQCGADVRVHQKNGWIKEPVKLGEAVPLVQFNKNCIHLFQPQSLLWSLSSSVKKRFFVDLGGRANIACVLTACQMGIYLRDQSESMG